MMNYMSLAPPWAQALPQPPPAAMFTGGEAVKDATSMVEQRTVEAGGGWGANLNAECGVHHDLRPGLGLRKERVGGEPTRGRYRSGAVALKKAGGSAFPLPSGLTSDRHHRRSGAGNPARCAGGTNRAYDSNF